MHHIDFAHEYIFAARALLASYGKVAETEMQLYYGILQRAVISFW